jgi:DNA topoisomerase III
MINAMRLFIAEKPSLAQAIAQGLGMGTKNDGYIQCGNDIVTWCFGHIMEQYSPEDYDEKYKRWQLKDLPILPENWQLKVSPTCVKQYKIIKTLVNKADEIVNAGDPDREGQLLIDEVLNVLGVLSKKPILRILLNALDDVSVQQALKNLRDNQDFVGLRNSALARSRADWIIGMNLSRMYTLKAREAGYTGVISVGRVQTPTMALVVRREEEIRNFKAVEHYQLRVVWNHENGMFASTWQPAETTKSLDSEGRLLDKGIAETLAFKIAGKDGCIRKTEQKRGHVLQRLPYSLSALQIDAGKKFGYTPQEVLDAQQHLYEKKLTTYPRSDCDYIPTNQFADASLILKNLRELPDAFSSYIDNADIHIKSRAWNDKKISAHHAIIPTTMRADFTGLSAIEKNLYILISKAYVAQFYPEQTFLSTKVWIDCEGENFTSTGRVILEEGWKKLYPCDHAGEEKDEEEVNQELPAMQENDKVFYQKHAIMERVTKPPQRFNPSTLLAAMKEIHKYVKDENLKSVLKECSGIGTEATRASIIDTIQNRGFVSIEKKYFVPTEKAYMMLKVLSENITYPDITAQWEKSLDAISRKEMQLQDFFEQQKKFMDTLLLEARNLKIDPPRDVVRCPKCGKPMVRRKGKKGFFWGCTGYPNCTMLLSDQKGKPDTAPKNTHKPAYKGKFKNM